uniref:small ubiquitin-related modifier 1-like n=1 Tax=Fragaria vesca subsp. vesca TaxID=101020 RepID=UPI0005CA62A8|nr:PREDICTED: small ubiquitin-related modifier 1-like [Fragaria vesca subsp. vesca]
MGDEVDEVVVDQAVADAPDAHHVEPDPPTRNIIFKMHQGGGNQLSYNIPEGQGTTVGGIMDDFCLSQGVFTHEFVFLYDGLRLARNHTFDEWEMLDGDFVDVIPIGMGGGAGGGHSVSELINTEVILGA